MTDREKKKERKELLDAALVVKLRRGSDEEALLIAEAIPGLLDEIEELEHPTPSLGELLGME